MQALFRRLSPSSSPYEESNPTFKLLRILNRECDVRSDTPQASVINCELFWSCLYNRSDYEALSYTWGSSVRDCPIRIRVRPYRPAALGPTDIELQPNDIASNAAEQPVISITETKVVNVTKHLHNALLKLQLPLEDRLVWIDQLCIDQENVQERNEQVRQMAEIYRFAKRTIVWLGEGAMDPEDEAFTMATANRMNYRPVEREYSTIEDQNLLKGLIGFGNGEHYSKAGLRRRHALAEILNRPWFTRAWVFQEAVISRSGLIICGGLDMDLDIFINVLDGVCDLDSQDVGLTRSIMRRSSGYDPMFAIREARYEGRTGKSSPQKDEFLSILWQAMRNLDATNPRDKVYAFLAFHEKGMAPDLRVPPCYEAPTASVFTDAARRIICSTSSLDILELAPKDEGLFSSLPSWVPDFSKPLPTLPFMTHNVGSTPNRASGSRRHEVEFHRPTSGLWLDSHLIIKGCPISKIIAICPLDFPTDGAASTLHSYLQLELTTSWVNSILSSLNPTHLRNSTEEDLLIQTLRTLLASGSGSTDAPGNLDFSKPLDLLAAYNNEPAILSNHAAGTLNTPRRPSKDPAIAELQLQWRYLRWMTDVSRICQAKKLFVTEGGDLGLVWKEVRVGDEIVVVEGAKTVSVLRGEGERDDDESGIAELRRWKLISQCYLDGWMRGKAVGGGEEAWLDGGAELFALV